jgi:hypothetical protein
VRRQRVTGTEPARRPGRAWSSAARSRPSLLVGSILELAKLANMHARLGDFDPRGLAPLLRLGSRAGIADGKGGMRRGVRTGHDGIPWAGAVLEKQVEPEAARNIV